MKILYFIVSYFFIIFSLYAKTEIDKAFVKRGSGGTGKFTLYSPDAYSGKQIARDQVFDENGCGGLNISPKLVWKNAPKNTRSFAVAMYDQNVLGDGVWWNWILYNIPSNTKTLETGSNKNKKLLPKGAKYALNDYGYRNYSGPCADTKKRHNYVITLYALDVEKLEIPKNATPAMSILQINKHTIAKVQIKAYYIGQNTTNNTDDKKVKYTLQSQSNNSRRK